MDAGTGPSELRLVTVLFTDLVAFTPMAEKLGPERTAELLERCWDRISPVLDRYGASIEAYGGDQIVVRFGAPVTHEDDPDRACRAALEMRAELAELDTEMRPVLGQPLAFRMAINSGRVMAGEVGASQRREYGITGEPVNVAARLCAAARPGTILVSEATRRLTRGDLSFLEPRSLQLRGVSSPVTAYRLEGAADGRRALPQQSPLVGRAEEFATLTEMAAQIADGRGEVVALLGEAGMGKTRLVAELRRQTQGELRWLEGDAIPFGQRLPFQPWLHVLRAAFGLTADDAAGSLRVKLEKGLAELPALADVLPYLEALVTLSSGRGELADSAARLDARSLHYRIFSAFRAVVESLSGAQPTLIALEDAHWADQSSLELARYLAPAVRERSLGLLLIARPEPEGALRVLRTDLMSIAPYREIVLAPLGAEDSRRLAGNLLPGGHFPAHVEDLVLTRAGGNPLFVEELVRSLAEAGALQPSSAGWQLETPKLDVPAGLRGLLAARLDRLPTDARHVLQVAAVIGTDFSTSLLVELVQNETLVNEALEVLRAADLVYRKDQPAWSFKHALIREVTYESLPTAQRKRWHARLSEVLHEGEVEDLQGTIAYHLLAAEQWDNALAHLVAAGERAHRLYANREALSYFLQAVSLYQETRGGGEDTLRLASWEARIGEGFYRQGEHERSEIHLRRALRLLGQKLPSGRATLLASLLGQAGGRLVRSLPKPKAGRADPVAAELVRIWNRLVYVYYFTDPERAMYCLLKAERASERLGTSSELARACLDMAAVLDLVPFARMAERYLELAKRLFKEVGDPLGDAVTRWREGLHGWQRGNWPEAAEEMLAGAKEAMAQGEFWEASAARTAAAITRWFQGRFDESRAIGEDLLAEAEGFGDTEVLGWGLLLVAGADLAAGRWEAAEAGAERAATELERVLDPSTLAWSKGLRASALMGLGELEEGATLAASALGDIRTGRLRAPVIVFALRAGCEAALAMMEAGRGSRHNAVAACRSALRHTRIFKGGSPAAHRFRGTLEWLRDRPGQALHWWTRSLKEAAQLGAAYEGALTLVEMGDRLTSVADPAGPRHRREGLEQLRSLGVGG